MMFRTESIKIRKRTWATIQSMNRGTDFDIFLVIKIQKNVWDQSVVNLWNDWNKRFYRTTRCESTYGGVDAAHREVSRRFKKPKPTTERSHTTLISNSAEASLEISILWWMPSRVAAPAIRSGSKYGSVIEEQRLWVSQSLSVMVNRRARMRKTLLSVLILVAIPC